MGAVEMEGMKQQLASLGVLRLVPLLADACTRNACELFVSGRDECGCW